MKVYRLCYAPTMEYFNVFGKSESDAVERLMRILGDEDADAMAIISVCN